MSRAGLAAVTVPPFSTEWTASTASPAFLLPVRLEMKRIAGHICVRVFPDQPLLNTHQDELTKAERDAGATLHDLMHDHDLNDPTIADSQTLQDARGQWAKLARRYGIQRAAWILRRLAENGNTTTDTDPTEVIP